MCTTFGVSLRVRSKYILDVLFGILIFPPFLHNSPGAKPPKMGEALMGVLYYDFFAEMSSLRCLVTDSDGCPASMFGLFFCNTNCKGLYLHMLYLLGLQLVKRVLMESL